MNRLNPWVEKLKPSDNTSEARIGVDLGEVFPSFAEDAGVLSADVVLPPDCFAITELFLLDGSYWCAAFPILAPCINTGGAVAAII